MQSVRQRVTSSLQANRGKLRCGLCIAHEIKAKTQSVREAMRFLTSPVQARFSAVSTEKAKCHSCGNRRTVVYLPEASAILGEPLRNEINSSTRIVNAEAVGDSVVLEFDDGRVGAYSAETLYLLMPMEFELARKIRKLLD
jgi:hypothetical protein